MNQVSLNLVAALVGAMTFSVLLGPLLHIPQEIPAIAVFCILGLATLDNFSFQGRGTGLVVDWFAQRSPQHRARVIHHEAGHFLVAQRLGIPITGYTLSAWEAMRRGQPGAGGVSFAEPAIAEGKISAELLDQYCTLWMAGIAAELEVYGAAEGGAEDRQKLWGLVQFLKLNGQQKERLALLRAKGLLKENWTAYEALVKAMEQRSPVEECLTILDNMSSSAMPSETA
jgi:hypothetical protein